MHLNQEIKQEVAQTLLTDFIKLDLAHDILQQAIDALAEPFFVKDRRHRWIICNEAICKQIGHPREEILGKSDFDYSTPEQASVFWQTDDEVFNTGHPVMNEEMITFPDGTLHTIYTRKYPLKDSTGKVIALSGFITDITELERRQFKIKQLEESVIKQMDTIELQRLLLEQISTPILEVWEHILLLPLIGLIDSYRAIRLTDSLLTAISRTKARILIMDITGVPLVDSSVAGHLLQSILAARLLGCKSILVGIHPHVAQIMVQLGIDFSQITTRATLREGLKHAIALLAH